jgi:high-affinity Fe2+/Pb2+ permease
MLMAATVLAYMSYWLTRPAAEQWPHHLGATVGASLGAGPCVALWSTALLALYLEGAATVLIYQASLTGSHAAEATAVLAGLGVGVLAAVTLAGLLRSGAMRLPRRACFAVASAVHYGLAFVLAGRGVRALQASGVIGVTLAARTPTWELLGV